jgi:hypothetical protein
MKPSSGKAVWRDGNAASAAQTIQGFAVAEYRLYCLDGANKVASADWIDAGDDSAAVELARGMHNGYQCELWQGKRLVARLDLRRQA